MELDTLTDSDLRALARIHPGAAGVTTGPDTMDRFERAGLIRCREAHRDNGLESGSFTNFGHGVLAACRRFYA